MSPRHFSIGPYDNFEPQRVDDFFTDPAESETNDATETDHMQDRDEYNDSDDVLEDVIETARNRGEAVSSGAWLAKPLPFEPDTIGVYRLLHTIEKEDEDQ